MGKPIVSGYRDSRFIEGDLTPMETLYFITEYGETCESDRKPFSPNFTANRWYPSEFDAYEIKSLFEFIGNYFDPRVK